MFRLCHLARGGMPPLQSRILALLFEPNFTCWSSSSQPTAETDTCCRTSGERQRQSNHFYTEFLLVLYSSVPVSTRHISSHPILHEQVNCRLPVYAAGHRFDHGFTLDTEHNNHALHSLSLGLFLWRPNSIFQQEVQLPYTFFTACCCAVTRVTFLSYILRSWSPSRRDFVPYQPRRLKPDIDIKTQSIIWIDHIPRHIWTTPTRRK